MATATKKRQPGTRDPKERARRRLTTKVANMEKSEANAERDRDAWEKEVLDSYDAGLSYGEIAKLSDKSRVRIDQVIRKERQRRGIKINSQ